jgi:hypothetical protein
MPRLAMTMPHRLGREEARRRLKEKLAALRDTYGHQALALREEWNEYTLSFGFEARGIAVDGTMVVEDGEVRLSAEVPFRVVIFKRVIEKRIRAELGDLLL